MLTFMQIGGCKQKSLPVGGCALSSPSEHENLQGSKVQSSVTGSHAPKVIPFSAAAMCVVRSHIVLEKYFHTLFNCFKLLWSLVINENKH